MKLAFVFPGQGSQSVGMLAGFAADPTVAALVERADAALGEPLGALIAQGPADDLNLTVNTQPAMLLAGYACHAAWRAAGGAEAIAVAGHSLGEYTALAAVDAIDFGDALRIVRLRARAMQEAVPVGTGGMAAILGLDDATVLAVCRDACDAGVVEAVNFNAPAQVVVAGERAAVTRACEIAKERGAKRALPLPVSAPFHSSLLEPAGRRLREALAGVQLRVPRVPLVNNVDVAIEETPEGIVDALVRQAYNPVRWVEVVRKLRQIGVTHVIEFGPGKVLAGLVKRIDGEMKVSAVHDPASLRATLEELQ